MLSTGVIMYNLPLYVSTGVHGVTGGDQKASSDLSRQERLCDGAVPYAGLQEARPVGVGDQGLQVVPVTDTGHDHHKRQYHQRSQHVEYPFHQFYRIVKTEKHSVDKIVPM